MEANLADASDTDRVTPSAPVNFRPDLDHEPDIYPVLGLPLAPPASMLFGFLAVASCDKTSRAMAVL